MPRAARIRSGERSPLISLTGGRYGNSSGGCELSTALSSLQHLDEESVHAPRSNHSIDARVRKTLRKGHVGVTNVPCSAADKKPSRRLLKEIASRGEWLASLLLQHAMRFLCTDSFHQRDFAQRFSLRNV